MLWGHIYTSIPTISHKRRSGRHPTEYSTGQYSKKGYVPEIIYMCGYITQLQMRQWLIIQKSTQLLSAIMLACESIKEKASQKWPMYSKIWSCHKKQHKRDPDNTNMIQMNQVFTNPSKEEVA
jgi:hypothetical protein